MRSVLGICLTEIRPRGDWSVGFSRFDHARTWPRSKNVIDSPPEDAEDSGRRRLSLA